MKLLFVLFLVLTMGQMGFGQKMTFDYEKVPKESGFIMDGYWIWCGSMIKVGSTYHLFASRWKKKGGDFPEGYRQNSEIVRASSKSPLGPFKFEEVVIGERDSSFWDSNMAHNPTIHKIGDEYVLFYIGSDFNTYATTYNQKSLVRRIGYASSKSITGPWKRCDQPIINAESNNPAILVDGTKIKLLYRDAYLKVILAESDNYKGGFKTVNEDVSPTCKLEDFYLFKSDNQYHIVCEDNVGGVSGHERWGVHLHSVDGVKDWKSYEPVVVYNHDILFTDNTALKCTRRERPQLFIENGLITYLITAVYDGKNTWSQPVKLKTPIKIMRYTLFEKQ
jgi:hypothetical protein